MDALIKICEDELRRRKMQNPRLIGYELKPVLVSAFRLLATAPSVLYEYAPTPNTFLIGKNFSFTRQITVVGRTTLIATLAEVNPLKNSVRLLSFTSVNNPQAPNLIVAQNRLRVQISYNSTQAWVPLEAMFNLELYEVSFYTS